MYNHHQEQNNNIPPNSLFMSNQPNNNKLIQINNPTSTQDSALALLLPLLVLLSSLLFLLLLFLIFLIVLRRRRSHHHPSSTRRHLLRLGDNDGPLDLSIPEEPEIEGGIEGLERRWLESCSQATRNGYLRAKMYQTHHRPNSLPTDITLSQFLSIQEKGVSAWAFEPDYDSNPSLPILVQSRTEIIFLADGAGMSEEEGGGVCVQSNLPLPKLNEVYYFECKIYDKPEGSEVAIGLATKPYPSFRLPGWNRLSIGYFSGDGFKSHNYPFTATSYGPPLKEGDVLGVGYRPRTGSVFFTRNGKKLEDAYVGLNRFNLFPTIGATGPASVHVNLGQAGFVFIEANVKKWGLAPMAGTLAPPPAYGHQMGSILLASATQSSTTNNNNNNDQQQQQLLNSSPSPSHSHSQPSYADLQGHYDSSEDNLTDRSSIETVRAASQRRRRRHRLIGYSTIDTQSSDPHLPHNPPTPRPLDISLEHLSNPSSTRHPRPSVIDHSDDPSDDDDSQHHHQRQQQQDQQRGQSRRPSRSSRAGSSSRSDRHSLAQPDILPPQYAPIDPYKYAAGVAEVMLSEQFHGSSSHHSFPVNNSTVANHPHLRSNSRS
ncbi:uncharacterized protein PGTG_10273 [Puccinia graminis f. sp. tritici CRL 75-36-700-3]|uniref:B30.2/SPRY domain-containing protein n=1 Tax=Puccinia graminis f. sp. tritici (strain CRL 75-36-700-3 / race SCCL) TaxID=418459 RepID=E3KKH7_PUCGT|nr:uncharacterized protein PGTG_10273 [Puccinia graminis f. sp. tritici CRL 75-36-700-3]EFP84802.2 hypothetical protein PGTG_10273 [Puccinia graminis f. sp. tritici CRL 75-36-700-3]